MTAQSGFFSTVARCLLFSFAMAVLGSTWGCGEVPSQATLDDAAKARIDEAHDAMKKARERKKAAQPVAGPKRR